MLLYQAQQFQGIFQVNFVDPSGTEGKKNQEN